MEQLAKNQARMQKIRQKGNFPSLSTYVRNWVPECELCTQDKRKNNTQRTPEVNHITEKHFRPEDLMQIDLWPEVPPSGRLRGYYAGS